MLFLFTEGIIMAGLGGIIIALSLVLWLMRDKKNN